MEVANTILEQLGGNKFRAMTGAKNFVGSDNSLAFQIPRSNGVQKVIVTLDPSDTYSMEFGKFTKGIYKDIITYEGLYWDNLQDMFTQATGLYTSL